MTTDFNDKGFLTGGKKWVAATLLVATMAAMGAATAASPAHADSPYVVNSTGDQSDPSPGDGNCGAFGQCTLRAAIQDANAHPGADVIGFNVPGRAFIRPDTPLPTITEQTVIDGYTQPGSSPNTLAAGDNAVISVELFGDIAGTSAAGLDITGSNVSVRGLQITQFDGSGVQIRNQGSTATLGVNVQGNFIGTDGSNDLGNGGDGIEFFGSNTGRHVIGGDSPADRNVVSGNERSGIDLDGVVNNNTIQGNYIGTDASGTNASTNDDLGNDSSGIELDSSGGNIVKSNVISGNDFDGVFISGPDGSDNKVLGNRIGTDRTGTKDLGNGGSGVDITRGVSNKVGDGTVPGSNTIAFNDRGGVEISGEAENTKLNTVSRNSIFSNGSANFDAKGIALSSSNLPLPNDPKDVDTGANGFQNYPVLSSARTSAAGTTVTGKLNSTPDAFFAVEFYSNPKNTGEGKTFLGKKTVTTDAGGNVSFSFTTKSKLPAGRNITATATRLFLGPTDTSEFSAPRTVVADLAAPRVVSVSPSAGANKVPAASNVTVTFNEAMQPGTVNARTVKLKRAGSTAYVAAKVTYDKAKRKAILNPATALKKGTAYTAVVNPGVRDLAGNALDQDPKASGKQSKTWSYAIKK